MGRQRRSGPVFDAWWLGVGVVAWLGLLGAAAQLWLGIVGTDALASIQAAAGGVCAWWFLAGAWRRTSWGRPVVAVGHEAPVLSARTVSRLIAVAALCLGSVAVALFVQLVTAG